MINMNTILAVARVLSGKPVMYRVQLYVDGEISVLSPASLYECALMDGMDGSVNFYGEGRHMVKDCIFAFLNDVNDNL